MQDFYAKIRQDYTQSNEKVPIFLHPEQIQPKTVKQKQHNTNAIIRLAESIKRYGIITPLSVQKSREEKGIGSYELIDGEQRLRAAALAGITKIPCIILPQDDKSYAVNGIIEHLRAQGLHMFEQAAAFRLLMQDFSLTQEEIAQKLGVSQSAIANKLRLLKLSHEEQRMILDYGLTERHARSILRLKEPQARAVALKRIHEKQLNVAETEELIEELLATHQGSRGAAISSITLQKAEETAPKPQISPVFTTVFSPETPPSGCVPRKFAIPDLTPLYNSIERTLSIFRKTGASASCMREEGENIVRIIIEIPKSV